MSKAPENSVKRYGINAASTVATRLLQLTVLVWVNQFLLRRIAPEEYSLYPLVLSLMVFAELFRSVFTSGLGRYIVEADSRDDAAGVTRVVSSMFPVLLLLAGFFLAGGGLMAWQLDRLLTIEPAYLGDARLMLLLLVATLCVNVVSAPFTEGLYVRQRFVAMNLIALGGECVRIGVLVALLFGCGTKVLWLVVATTCGVLTTVSLHWAMTWRMLPAARFRRESFSLATVRMLFGFGAWTTVGGLTSMVSSTVPMLLLNRFGTALDITLLHLGRLPDTQLRNVISAISGPAQPALTRMFAREGASALTNLYYRGGRYYLWLSLIFVVPFLVFGRELIVLYAGPQYAGAASVMIVLLGIYPCVWASAMFFQVVFAMGKVREFYLCDLVIQLVTLGALYYLVVARGMGAPGAALALGLTSGLLHMVLIWPMGLASVGGRWKNFARQTLLPGLVPFAASVAVACGLREVFEPNSWFSLGAACAGSVAAYLLVMFTFCLDPFDRSLVARGVAKVRARFDRGGGGVECKAA
jgi:O-antigen/teichoic acid export membrane protein